MDYIIIMNLFVMLLFPFCISGFSRITTPSKIVNCEPVIVGSTKPIENFDPLNLGDSNEKMLFFREAELKHGRLAMVVTTLFPIIESHTHQPAVHEFSNLPNYLQLGLVSLMFVSEFSTMIRGWKNPFVKDETTQTSNYFKLLEHYQPGDLGFELTTDLDSVKGRELLNKELNNGRLAMIATLGMITQELVTKQTLF